MKRWFELSYLKKICNDLTKYSDRLLSVVCPSVHVSVNLSHFRLLEVELTRNFIEIYLVKFMWNLSFMWISHMAILPLRTKRISQFLTNCHEILNSKAMGPPFQKCEKIKCSTFILSISWNAKYCYVIHFLWCIFILFWSLASDL